MDQRSQCKEWNYCIKVREEDLDEFFCNLGVREGFVSMIQNPDVTKGKTSKFDYLKIKIRLLHGKKSSKYKVKRHIQNWEKTFTIHKGLIFLICKEPLKIEGKERPNRKRPRQFSQKSITIALTHMKDIYSLSWIGRVEIKTALR